MRRRAAGDLGEDLLHDGAVTALTSSLGQLERGIGEGRVVTPGGKQFALPVSGLLVQVPDPADDQSRGDGLALFAANAVYRTSATWAPETQAPSWSSQTAGHRIGVPASSQMAAIAVRMLAFIAAMPEKRAPLRRIASITAAL
jgi:hypothetical protein